jgi:hypothetical protein
MKKILKTIFLLSLALMPFILGNLVSAQGETYDFPYDIPSDTQVLTDDNPTDISQVVNNDAIAPTNSILDRLTKFFRVSGTSYNPDNTGSPALNYVKRILNIVLGLVGLIALVLIIFAFYLIFFAKADDAVKKAKKILTGVAIALFIMGLSRFIVSFFFDIFNSTV